MNARNPRLWEVRPVDRECFERDLQSFVPDRVYDMHAHLWRETDWEGKAPPMVLGAPPEVGLKVYREAMGWILPGREVHALHFPFPAVFPNNPDPCNQWVSAEVRKDPLSRGQYYVRPDDDPDRTREEVKRLGLRGFKPFAGFAPRPDKGNAEIPEYFPEWIARLAGEEGWSVTLHMQRPRSLADPSNQHWIRTYCSRYPGMTLILDHCARGFNPYHLIEGLPAVRGLPNLYADTSVACSPLAMIACLQSFGVRNMLYASDFFCSHMRGVNLPVGDGFTWLTEDSDFWPHMPARGLAVLIGLESLRALRAACETLRLSDADIEAVFWGNAARVLGLF